MTSHSKAQITKQAYDRLLMLCTESIPMEACGVLAATEGSPAINTVISIPNASPTPFTTFEFEPKEWTRIFFDMQKNRQILAGFFHSHPKSSGTPSYRDQKGVLPSAELSYWIVSTGDDGIAKASPYLFLNEEFTLLQLVLA